MTERPFDEDEFHTSEETVVAWYYRTHPDQMAAANKRYDALRAAGLGVWDRGPGPIYEDDQGVLRRGIKPDHSVSDGEETALRRAIADVAASGGTIRIHDAGADQIVGELTDNGVIWREDSK